MNKLIKKSSIEKDIAVSRCTGLLKQTALKKRNNQRVHAEVANKKDGPFYCPTCLSEAIVRKCTEKIDHFAHKARASKTISGKDQELHDYCKNSICEYLQMKFPNGRFQVERPTKIDKVKGWDKQIIPDISGIIKGIPLAVEVQKSPYTLPKIIAKTKEYFKRKISVLWIVPLKKPLGEEPFRPRLYEKYLHMMYYGRVYYWHQDTHPYLLPVHYSPTCRYIEPAYWYEDGHLMEAGGFYLTYKTLKLPKYGKNVLIDTDFFSHERSYFLPLNHRKKIPKSNIYMDRLDTWWDVDEKQDIDKQMEIAHQLSVLTDYQYQDDYEE